jgi:hypothetical protein
MRQGLYDLHVMEGEFETLRGEMTGLGHTAPEEQSQDINPGLPETAHGYSGHRLGDFGVRKLGPSA